LTKFLTLCSSKQSSVDQESICFHSSENHRKTRQLKPELCRPAALCGSNFLLGSFHVSLCFGARGWPHLGRGKTPCSHPRFQIGLTTSKWRFVTAISIASDRPALGMIDDSTQSTFLPRTPSVTTPCVRAGRGLTHSFCQHAQGDCFREGHECECDCDCFTLIRRRR
jgi:hypothetical protein